MNFRGRSIVGAVAFVAAAFACSTAFAQQTQNAVATLKDVEGNVLISQGDAMVAGSLDQRLPAGTRVVTTAGSKVRINYDVGCDVRLDENQRFTVRVGPCAILLAEVEALGPAAGAIGGGTATASAAGVNIGTIAGIGGLVGLGVGAYELLKNNNGTVVVSPN